MRAVRRRAHDQKCRTETRGADLNARDTGDNAYPLHFAAANGHLDVVRALLDAGGDVHGVGDVHEADVIGWVTAL
jgi:ankyrin repeat protein